MYQRRLCMFALSVAMVLACSTAAPGKVLFEYWFDIGGGVNVNADLRSAAAFPALPSQTELLDALKGPVDWKDNYGLRARALLTAPETGDYTFWVSGDDNCELWLSSDDTAFNAKLIAQVASWTGVEEWGKEAGQKSAPIALVAGQKYYIEMLLKEGGGGDSITAAWGGPASIGAGPVVIGGAYLTAPDPASLGTDPAISPNPASGSVDIVAPLFMWKAGKSAMLDDVYFGTDPNPGAAQFMGRQPSMMALFFYPMPLEPGAVYYWRVDGIDAVGNKYVGNVWSFTVMPAKATVPSPKDGAKGMSVTPTLTWKAGQNSPTHDLYLGTEKAAVEAGDAGVFKGNLVDASFEVTEALAFDTTYYWRVDEIDAAGTKFVGDVWSFKTTLEILGKIRRQIWEGIGSGTAVTDLMNNANFPLKPTKTEIATSFRTPDRGISNYGGRMSAWLHVPADGDYTFWIASDDASQLWLGTTPGTAVQIASVAGWAGDMAWDSNASQKSAVQALKAGVYFIDALWKEGGGGDHCSVAWQGPDIAREVIPGGFCEYFVGYWAEKPSPTNGATGVTQSPTLSWASGAKTVKHNVYFGDALGKVTDATPSKGEFKGSLDVGVTTFTPAGPLTFDKTYYWRVDEVNDADPTSPWKGATWSFRVADYLFVNNSQRTLGYDNFNSPFYTEMAYDVPADWTVNGIEALSLEFQGITPPPAAKGSTTIDGPGAYTLTGAGTDIWGTSDQFQFGYMKLTGDGSIVAKVESVENKNVWAKGGVMIRQSAAPDSAYAMMCATGGGAGTGGGVNFQWRASASASAAGGPNGPGVACPYWVKLDRVGNVFTAFSSPDGAAWTQLGDPQTIAMTETVLMGVFYTSHVDNKTFGTAKFTNVVPTGNIDPASANNLDIGYGNSPQPVYVAVEDAAGKAAVATYPESGATNIISWTSWKIKLSDLAAAGVDLKNMAKLYVGVGDSLNPTPDGVGRILVRNVRVVKAVALGSPISSVVRAGGTSGDRSPCGAFNGATAPRGTQSGGLRDGNLCFSDRDYPWAKTPAELVGASYVRMFNTDKGTDAGTYTVTLTREAKVMITHDDRIQPAQAAVDKIVAAFAAAGTFVDTGVDVFVHENATTDRPQSVFAAVLPAGTYVFATEKGDINEYVIAAQNTTPVDVTNSTDNVLGLPNNFNWPAAEFPRNVIDNGSAKFLHFSGATMATGFTVQPFVGSSIVTGLTFTSANDSAERDPVKYELSGSNDGLQGPWTAIAAGDIVDFAGATAWVRDTKGTTPITFENTVAYKFYQVMFPACRGPNQNSMQIREVELLGVLGQ